MSTARLVGIIIHTCTRTVSVNQTHTNIGCSADSILLWQLENFSGFSSHRVKYSPPSSACSLFIISSQSLLIPSPPFTVWLWTDGSAASTNQVRSAGKEKNVRTDFSFCFNLTLLSFHDLLSLQLLGIRLIKNMHSGAPPELLMWHENHPTLWHNISVVIWDDTNDLKCLTREYLRATLLHPFTLLWVCVFTQTASEDDYEL